ncbi:hypothetical protein JB92DRAFT_3006565 [Gautieria morchelliformis]|nr:hypothetical protein JB92DRAFT_3006565 [Gautieria morchelliformis]
MDKALCLGCMVVSKLCHNTYPRSTFSILCRTCLPPPHSINFPRHPPPLAQDI